jgi:hypothetical protein
MFFVFLCPVIPLNVHDAIFFICGFGKKVCAVCPEASRCPVTIYVENRYPDYKKKLSLSLAKVKQDQF